MAEALGGGEAGDRPFGQRDPGAAEPRAVAEREDFRDAGLAALRASGHEMAAPRIEIVRRAERPQHLVGRLKAVAEADGVDLECLVAPAAVERCRHAR